jgi:alanine dehydrogenase
MDMKIGVVKEIKDQEHRVALTPSGAAVLVQAGHNVRLETGAGLGAGFADAAYQEQGAQIVSTAGAWDSELVLKVKEPLQEEYAYFQGQILFTYLHLAGVHPALTTALLDRNVTAIAYETVQDSSGRLPLLAPMSAMAGTMAVPVGAYYLATFTGGKGVLLGTMLGQRHGQVVVIGDGVVGQHAARAAAGLGAQVTLCGRRSGRELSWLGDLAIQVQYLESTPESIAQCVAQADLVIGAVLIPGAKAPYVVTEAMVQCMQPGSVIVDVSIDQGGCVATSRPTSHSHPVYAQHGVIHYCVTNMPGAYPRTSTLALTSATLPYVLALANKGLAACQRDAGFGRGVNVYQGHITLQPVAEALGLIDLYQPLATLLSSLGA